MEDTHQFEVHRTRELPLVSAARHTRRVAVMLLGGTVTVIGVILIPLPGPGTAIVFLGLTILSWEFAFAKRLIFRIKMKVKQIRAGRGGPAGG